MRAYIIRRLLITVVVVIIVSFFVFSLIHLTPGDPARIMLGLEASKEEVDALRAELWLDRPLMVQYGHWLSNFVQGDFGNSIRYGEPVVDLLARRLPISLHIGLLGIILVNLIGIPLGIICAVRRGTFLDQAITSIANVGISIPVFWLAILGIYFFGLKLGWLPIYGYTSPFDDFWLSTRQLIMPVFCIGVVPAAAVARLARSTMLEVTRQDYMRTAWSKGLRERDVIIRHGLKNSIQPIITMVGIQIAHVVTGSVFVEQVFNIPGVGRLIVQATFDKDFIVIQACVMLIAVTVCLCNLAVDVIYGWIDPRITYE